MKLAKENLGKVSITVEKDYHSVEKEYDKLVVVEEENQFRTFISRKPVPIGIELTDREYWLPFSSVKESIIIDYNKFKQYIRTGEGLLDDSIVERHIKNRNITGDKIAENTITFVNINDNTITLNKINDGAIDTTLTKEGYLAEAKHTGDRLLNIEGLSVVKVPSTQSTVLDAWQLIDKKGNIHGVTINTYKDKSIDAIWLSINENDSKPENPEVKVNNPKYLNIIYNKADGTQQKVSIPLASFVTEAEFSKNGFKVIDGVVNLKISSDITTSRYFHFDADGNITLDGFEERILEDLGTLEHSQPGDGTMWGEFKKQEIIREQVSNSEHQVFADNWNAQDDDPEIPQDKEVVDEASYAYNWKTTDTPASDGKREGNLKDLYNKSLEHIVKLAELEGNVVNIIGGDTDLTFEEVDGKYYGLDGNLFDAESCQYAEIDITNYARGKLTLSITGKVSVSSACSGIYKDGAFVNRVREEDYTSAVTWDIPENAVLKVSHNKQSSVKVSIFVNGELVELKERVKSLEDSAKDTVHYNDEIKKEVVIADTLYDKDGNIATKDNITTTTGCYLTLSNGLTKGGAALAVSDFVEVSQFTSFNIKGFYSTYTSIVAIVCFYDENKTYLNEYICQKIYPNNTLNVQVPDGAKYARFCSGISANFDGITNAIVEYDDSKTIRNIFDSLNLDELHKDIKGLKQETEGLNYETGELSKDIESLKQETSGLRSAVDGINLSDGSRYSKNSDNTVLYNQLLNPVKETMGLTAMINSWGFIGDSLSSGYIVYNTSAGYKSEHCYENSFGQKICSQCGSFGVNYSFGGATTKTWWNGFVGTTDKKGWKKGEGSVVEFGTIKHQAYIIGLGTNDINAGMDEGNVTTDINDDYNQNADTFVGNYAKIIQKIRETNEHAPIFCLIQPNGVMMATFDNAIRAIVNHFDGVFLIDTRADLSAVGITILSSHPYVYRGHWTTQGYQWMAYVLANEIDNIIRSNREYFDRVALIGTPADNGSIIW